MGIPLLAGHDFTPPDDETAPAVAIVNERMVAQYWHGEDPVGKRLQVKDKWLRIFGVARLAKYGSFGEPPKPFFYVPLRQDFSMRISLNIRTMQDPGTVATELAREIHGGLALLLAAIGLYGVMSYAVSQSTHELGLRMALGARASDLVRLVVSHGVVLTGSGVLLGTVAALALTRLIGKLLYDVNPRSPFAFGLALVVMMVATLAACFWPAWRATRIDPARPLRD